MSDFLNLQKKLEKIILRHLKDKHCALAFSGGIDSTLLALIMKKMMIEFTAYTSGMKSCYDHLRAKTVADEIGIPLRIIEVDRIEIEEAYKNMKKIMGTSSLLEISFHIPLYFVLRECDEKNVVTGQGADEIFGGYAKYASLSYRDAEKMMDLDLNKVIKYGIVWEKKIANFFKKTLYAPYLSEEVILNAKKIPIEIKIRKNDEVIRKYPLRMIAKSFCVSKEIVYAKKKAGQYGGGFMKVLKQIEKHQKY